MTASTTPEPDPRVATTTHLADCLRRIDEIRAAFYALPDDAPTEAIVKATCGLPPARDALEDAARALVALVSSGPAPAPTEPVIDAAHLAHQREWSTETFGPGRRTGGVLDHIRKELAEIEADPDDLSEWVDVVILALDGAWRHGWEPQQIIDAIKAKQARNEARTWPDWRTMSEHEAIEHDRAAVAAPGGNNPADPTPGEPEP